MTHAGAQEKREEEGVAERNCYGLTTAPFLTPLCHLGVGRRR